jgi:hypothetical protein
MENDSAGPMWPDDDFIQDLFFDNPSEVEVFKMKVISY